MKLELNVKRFNNEDVIATSGLCANINKYHIEVIQYNQGETEEVYSVYSSYNEVENELNYYSFYSRNLDDKGVDSTGWYYSTDGGNNFIKCDEDCEHPHGH